MASPELSYVKWLSDLGSSDVALVGGKNASLGEMIRNLGQAGIRVPDGFATTAEAYWDFLDANDLRDRIRDELQRCRDDGRPPAAAGPALRGLFGDARFPDDVVEQVRSAYRKLGESLGRDDPDVAVRSSATAEDLPHASFAGQQETFLNVRGEEAVLDAARRCFASLFTDRAIAYRESQGFDHTDVALSVGVQQMVRADRAGAGVMFSIDPETGFPRVVLVNAGWGLGEAVVSGRVDPDEYLVFKPLLGADERRSVISKRLGSKEAKVVYASAEDRPTRTVRTSQHERASYVLSDEEVLQLAEWAVAIEDHYGRAMDIEWAKDGEDGELFVVQARPETVHAHRGAALKTYRLKERGDVVVQGLAVGDAIGTGKVRNLTNPDDADVFETGEVLVTEMTDPDWVPIMKQAAAIVTDHGGRTSHAAIVSRELGIPAIVGTGRATEVLEDGLEVTISCAEGADGFVYEGILDHEEDDVDLEAIPETRTKVMLNLAEPAAAFRWWRLPADGVGLARMEFIVTDHIRIHPMALAHFDRLEDADARREIAELTRGFDDDKAEYFVENLASGIARIAASRWPDPVVVRMSDFKTNEYAELIGGGAFEPHEENPMLGWRGASRYYHEDYRDGFALECRAIARVRNEMGLTNVVVMIPFCRTLEEADRVLEVLAANGLGRGDNGLEVYVMAEIPANVILAQDFARRFDGFSVGSNDLTQLVLGVDRDSDALAPLFDERNPAVTRSIAQLIDDAHAQDRKVGLCGQAPSDDPSFATFLVEAGIDSISVAPDGFVAVKSHVADAEQEGHPGDGTNGEEA